MHQGKLKILILSGGPISKEGAFACCPDTGSAGTFQESLRAVIEPEHPSILLVKLLRFLFVAALFIPLFN